MNTDTVFKLIITSIVFLLWFFGTTENINNVGGDFIAYYCAVDNFLNFKDVYIQNSALTEAQLALGINPKHRFYPFFYPPWTLFFFSPFYLAGISLGIVIFKLLNSLAPVVICFYFSKCFSPRRYAYLLLAVVTFSPIANTIYWNQTGILSLFGFFLYLYFLNSKKGYPAGASLILLTFKLHVFTPLLAFLLFNHAREKELKVLYGFFVTFLFFVTITMLISPYILADWIEINVRGSAITFYTPTIINYVMKQLVGVHGWSLEEAKVFMKIGVVAVLFFSVICLFIKRKCVIYQSYLILTITFIITPYCWPHDYSIYLLFNILLLTYLRRSQFFIYGIGFCLLSFILANLNSLSWNPQMMLFLPLAYSIFFLAYKNKLKEIKFHID